jgi:hypothetical protein
MGYYTDFTITKIEGWYFNEAGEQVVGPMDQRLQKVCKFMAKVNAGPNATMGFHLSDVWRFNGKGYNYADCIVNAMRNFASVKSVTVHGVGEEEGDVWDHEFVREDDHIMARKFAFELRRCDTNSIDTRHAL